MVTPETSGRFGLSDHDLTASAAVVEPGAPEVGSPAMARSRAPVATKRWLQRV